MPRLITVPCLLSIVMGGVTPVHDLRVAREMRYRIAIVPTVVISTMVARVTEALETLRATQVHPPIPGNLSVQELFQKFGARKWDALRALLPARSDAT